MAYPDLNPIKLTLIAVSIAVSLAACGDSKEKKTATQVAAKVNGSEISVHQINAILSKAQGVPAEAVLDKLIDQQLAYDQAIEKKLDRNPDTMMAIESAKREIVSRAYIDQIIAALPKPTEDEANKYYAEQPNLFAKRRVYNLQELTIEGKREVFDELKQVVAGAKNLDEVAAWLKSKDVQFRAAGGARPAEQIGLDILPRLAELKDGQTALFDGGKTFTIIRVLASQSAPIDEATARPRIQQFLFNQKAQLAVAEEIKKLRASAKIERQGEFAAGAKPAAEAKPAETKPAELKPAETPVAPKAATTNLEKGVAGLK